MLFLMASDIKCNILSKRYGFKTYLIRPLVRYADIECQAWFNANEMVYFNLQKQSMEEFQVLSL